MSLNHIQFNNTNEEIMDFAGHTNYQTTKTYYIFSETTPEERKEAFEKALCKAII